MKRYIPVAEPALVGNEKKYVLDCLDTTWISSNGQYVERFEAEFAEFCNAKHAVSCCNGTAALHAALMALGVGPGDEVIIPTLTFVSTANAVSYCGAKSVFVDSEPETWNLNPSLIESLITSRTRGIIPVHLFGHPADMDPLFELAKKHDLFILEDAAEAHGAEYKSRRIGSLGDMAIFSFYGNKVLTTGEGGMIVTNDPSLAKKARLLKGQGMDPDRRYWFPIVGYNYRMTNIAAAIGVAQLEKADWHISRRREIAKQYSEHLGKMPGITLQPEKTWARNVYWMNSVLLDDLCGVSRDVMMAKLAEAGIETRPFFHPMHILPMYIELAGNNKFPIADRLSVSGLSLPSSATLAEDDVEFICDRISRIVKESRK